MPMRFIKWLASLHGIHIGLVLLALVALGSVGVGYLVQRNPYIYAVDKAVYLWVQTGPRFKVLDILIWPFNFDFLDWSGREPSFIYFLIGGFLGYLIWKRRREVPWAVLTMIIASTLILEISQLNWHFVSRKRPFLELPSVVDDYSREAWKNWSSYPSGHTRETALFSTIIAGYIPSLGIPAIVFVAFIAFSRVYLGAHYPTDVIAAALIGYLTARASLSITREVKKIWGEWRGRHKTQADS